MDSSSRRSVSARASRSIFAGSRAELVRAAQHTDLKVIEDGRQGTDLVTLSA